MRPSVEQLRSNYVNGIVASGRADKKTAERWAIRYIASLRTSDAQILADIINGVRVLQPLPPRKDDTD